MKQVEKINVLKLKPKRAKPRKSNAHNTYTNCSDCLSLLKINKEGKWECTGDRLETWKEEFKKYKNLSIDNKNKYLQTLTNKSKFLELYNSWIGGKLECNFNSRIYSNNHSYSQEIPDPMFVGKIERSLGRELTDEEKYGEIPIYKVGSSYTDSFEEGASLIEIPIILFPEEL